MSMPERSLFRFATSIALAGAIAVGGPGQVVQRDLFARRGPDDIRVMTWNVGSNEVMPPPAAPPDPAADGRLGQFARVLRAVRPDVLCLQQVTRGPRDVAAFVAAVLPPRRR